MGVVCSGKARICFDQVIEIDERAIAISDPQVFFKKLDARAPNVSPFRAPAVERVTVVFKVQIQKADCDACRNEKYGPDSMVSCPYEVEQ